MQLSLPTQALQTTLDQVSRAAAPKVGNNAYAGILLSAADNILEIQATDYQVSVRVRTPATVTEPGETVVLAAYLPELIKKLPAGTVEIQSQTGASTLLIRAGRSENEMVTGVAGEFPHLDELDHPQQFTLPSDQLRDMYSLTQFAVAGDNQRPIFSGILLEAGERAARMVATDTHRLALREVSLADALAQPVRLVIPERVLADVVRLLPTNEPVDVTISWHRDYVAFEFAGVYFMSNLIAGEFPDYERVFPARFDAKAIIDRREFTAALERAALISRNMAYKTVTLKWGDDSVEISATSAEVGSTEETLSVNYEGEALEIVFNCFYLLDILKRSTGDKITLHILQNGPMLVEQENDPDYRYVVTPMRGH
ncbi:DNA polymerase III subunit beta [Negativicoccus succinicivorans]|uniref:DNA polymerase III subunit beta n=1 Tax=Negativicoccus succinicivorans TaxID=620903 RepID=UPI0028FE0AE7|nr:DNA polymerase III subunit beta [Negativicoccus succinicivorans]MDU2930063.1 DNA polymerase III subunit beta [Negativicoccus succinicivorans]